MKNCGELGISRAIRENSVFCRYTCEACGADTHWRKVDNLRFFFELREKLRPLMAGQRFPTDEEEIAAWHDAARSELQILLRRVERQSAAGEYETLLIREKGCPACGAKQEWMKKPEKRSPEFKKPLIWINPEIDGAPMLSDFIDPSAQEMLSAPCSVEVSRLSSLFGTMEAVSVMLNGRHAGDLRIGTSTTLQTTVRHNVLSLHAAPGGPALAAVRFEAEPGGRVSRRFSGAKFK